MGQSYKNIYFPDHPGQRAKKHITLAFGHGDQQLFRAVQHLSSHELRALLGHQRFASLQNSAQAEDLRLNTYCLRLLRKKIKNGNGAAAQQLGFFANGQYQPLEAIQATFRGGQSEPLHTWYPLLEGYSPAFVEAIVKKFVPNATHILDPFAGTGTTPLTVARLGCTALYCEINPVLQYLTHTKLLALQIDPESREGIVGKLLDLVGRAEIVISSYPPDAQLARAYENTFGNSSFFDTLTYERVLRTRSLIDKLSCTEPLVANFLTIAVLASLIPSSLLIRRGDVRYKTETERNRLQNDYFTVLKRQLEIIAKDLQQIEDLSCSAIFLAEDARKLNLLPPLKVDAVITSPPYLNGTNYFRNTKVELWFLRRLHSAADLANFRARTVTAGINDVSSRKEVKELQSATLDDLISKLEANSYDSRIPKMVSLYFADLESVFSALNRHLKKGATLAVDLGDSCYGGIHVATDRILIELLARRGFHLEQEFTLRKRCSRGGMPLKQVLLLFRYGSKNRSVRVKPRRSLNGRRAWLKFTTDLPHQKGEYSKRNWGHPLHSLCSYQGKMKPALANHLIKVFVPEGGRMLDPFAGVGTIPFEAALNGIQAWGFDISPAAFQICAAKLQRPSHGECEESINELQSYLQDNEPTESELAEAERIRFNGQLSDYFEPTTFREVLLARRFFIEHPPSPASQCLVFACLLHILHGNRPYALSRRSHPITPFAPSGPAEYRSLVERLLQKVSRSLSVDYPEKFTPGTSFLQDATSWWPQEVDALDAVITSPPFFDSTRFYLANWMRLWFCGWEAQDFKTKPLFFLDERQKISFAAYEAVFRQARERLNPSGIFVLHLGKSRKCDMAAALSEIAKPWFKVAGLFSENVNHCESHGIRDKGTVTSHQYLLLK